MGELKVSVQEKLRPKKVKEEETAEDLNEEEKERVGAPETSEVATETLIEDFDVNTADLTNLERDIVVVAQEILKLKRYEAKLQVDRVENMNPLVDKLFATCIARFTYAKGYSKSEIFLTIKELERKNWIVTGQRRTRQEILENNIMQGILNLIEEAPGIHARDPLIQERLGITRNPFTKHVTTLASFDLIRIEKIGKTQNYFPLSSPKDLDELFVVLQNDLCLKMVQLLINKPGIGVLDLARELNVFHGAIQYHIKKLKTLGFLNENLEVNDKVAKIYNQFAKIYKLELKT
jgi:predicted transcriptional regulator